MTDAWVRTTAALNATFAAPPWRLGKTASGDAAPRALPTLPRQRRIAHDEHQLAALFNQFERLQTVRATLDVLIFGTTLWALVSYLS